VIIYKAVNKINGKLYIGKTVKSLANGKRKTRAGWSVTKIGD